MSSTLRNKCYSSETEGKKGATCYSMSDSICGCRTLHLLWLDSGFGIRPNPEEACNTRSEGGQKKLKRRQSRKEQWQLHDG